MPFHSFQLHVYNKHETIHAVYTILTRSSSHIFGGGDAWWLPIITKLFIALQSKFVSFTFLCVVYMCVYVLVCIYIQGGLSVSALNLLTHTTKQGKYIKFSMCVSLITSLLFCCWERRGLCCSICFPLITYLYFLHLTHACNKYTSVLWRIFIFMKYTIHTLKMWNMMFSPIFYS